MLLFSLKENFVRGLISEEISKKTQSEQVIAHHYYQFLSQASFLIIANLGSLISTFQNIVL